MKNPARAMRGIDRFALLLAIGAGTLSQPALAQSSETLRSEQPAPKKWYEKINLRGYAQFRYNRLGDPDELLVSPQGDRSIGGNNTFLMRRARMIFFGEISDNLSIYIQPDLASTPGGSSTGNFAQVRDWYADIFVDPAKEFRFRVGQSKVPYGFENLQSSQNRLALDRNDALNSAVRDERDLGIFFYWAPSEIRQRFKHLVDSGLKGSGDYGVVGLGAYAGQGANRPEQNDNMHVVGRVSYPYQFAGGQIVEAGVQGYVGRYGTNVSGLTNQSNGIHSLLDRRYAASLMVYPQPIGFQAEYTVGVGPQLNLEQTEVTSQSLRGGYAQVMYRLMDGLIPFARMQYYQGGRKHDTNSPGQTIRETELGTEWQITPAVEVTGMYTWTERPLAAAPYTNVKDNLIRLQLQWNY